MRKWTKIYTDTIFPEKQKSPINMTMSSSSVRKIYFKMIYYFFPQQTVDNKQKLESVHCW